MIITIIFFASFLIFLFIKIYQFGFYRGYNKARKSESDFYFNVIDTLFEELLEDNLKNDLDPNFVIKKNHKIGKN